MSSDSPFFDRYHHYATVGACESTTLAVPLVVHVPRRRGGHRHLRVVDRAATSATYDGWFGFDSIPVLNKVAARRSRSTSSPRTDSVAKHWLKAGASGWRLDVSGDASFPNGYWEIVPRRSSRRPTRRR